MKKIALPASVAVVVILIGTLVQGRLVGRAFPILGKAKVNVELEQFAQRMKDVPYEFGDWEGKDTEQTDEDRQQLVAAKVVGSLSRVYTNRRTGKQVSMMLVCGKSQNVADHTPDQCFRAAGYTMNKSPIRYTHDVSLGEAGADSSKDPAAAQLSIDFYTDLFQKQNPGEADDQARVFWTWRSTTDGWRAPRWPLITFAGTPALYKLYLLGPATSDVTGNAALNFSDAAMPQLEKVLFPAKADNAPDASKASDADNHDNAGGDAS